MSTTLFTLSLVLGFLTFIGLISPRKVLKGNANPTRKKVLFFIGGPAFVLFVAFAMIHESSWDLALKNPTEATEVSLKYKKLQILPEELQQMTSVVKLDLSKNELTELPEYLAGFASLTELDLSDNPISELPEWINRMPSLKVLTLDNTQIDRIPDMEGVAVTYKNTPMYAAEYPDGEPVEEVDDRDESLGEFAMRKFLGKD